MPQASDELRTKIAAYFPDDGTDEHYSAISSHNAERFLESVGWIVDKAWVCHPPLGKVHEEITDKEWDCVDFLIQEWDYGFSFIPALATGLT